MTPEKKKKVGGRSPLTSSTFVNETPAKSTTKAPLVSRVDYAASADGTSFGVEDPVYVEKGRAGRWRGRSSNRSDRGRVGMGWQERTARNNAIAANYRAALTAAASEKIAAGRDATAIQREGMSNRTVRDVAAGRDATLLEGTKMRTDTRRAIRTEMEGGLSKRQKSRQKFLGGEQTKKFDFYGEEGDKNRASKIQQIRERRAVDLVDAGVLGDPQQVRDYMESDEFSPGGLGDLDEFNTPTSRDFQYIQPLTGSRTDLKQGIVEKEILTPGRVFNKSTGTFKGEERRQIDEQSLMDKYFDDATGKTTIPADKLTDAELTVLLKKLREKNKN